MNLTKDIPTRGVVRAGDGVLRGAIRLNRKIIWHCLHIHAWQDQALTCADAALATAGITKEDTHEVRPTPQWRKEWGGRLKKLLTCP